MAGTDHKGDTPCVNPSGGAVLPPCLILNAVYTREAILANLKISDKTWLRMVKAGLPVCQPGTKQQYVVSNDVVDILRIAAGDLPERYHSPFEEKNLARAAEKSESNPAPTPTAKPRGRKQKE